MMLVQAERRISRALRQEQRVQAAYAAETAEKRRVEFVRGRPPASVMALDTEFRDELYFLLVAVRHAVLSHKVLAEKGFTVPAIRMEAALVSWRDIEEHWDDDARGVPVRAKKKWAQSGAQGDPGSWMTANAEGITDFNGISVIELRQDLEALLQAVKDLEQEAFEADWPTPEEAAAFMQMDFDIFQRLAPSGVVFLDWSHRGDGVRCQLSDLVKWKDRLVAQGEWPPTR
jgi:hypothetical protein